LLWAGLLLVFGQRSADPLDDITPLTPKQKLLGAAVLLLLAVLFTPQPLVVLA
jgi:hypothetical protein